jgi:hypothetical protein
LVGVQSAGSNQTPYVSVTNAVYVNPSTGTLYAVAKSFRIPHPTKSGKMLVYGSLEGPENGVYARGRLTGSNVIELPEYWAQLVHEDTITIQLTAIGRKQNLFVKNIKGNCIEIDYSDMEVHDIDCYYYIMAERKDVEKLIVEE